MNINSCKNRVLKFVQGALHNLELRVMVQRVKKRMHCYVIYTSVPLLGTLGALYLLLIRFAFNFTSNSPLYARLCSVAAAYPNMASDMPACARLCHTCRWQTEPL